MQSLKESGDLNGRRVLLRGDLDVPVVNGKVGEDYRLKALLPTLKYLLQKKAAVLILGHAGRPKGRKDVSLSLRPVVHWFSQELKEELSFLEDFPTGESSRPALAVLENLRFWPGEEGNDPDFAKKLAGLGDLFINDAFANSHRNHASMVLLPKLLPSYAGFQLEREVKELGSVLENPARPLVFILGGAKTETKVPLVAEFAKISDQVLIGGLLMFDRDLEGTPKVVFPVDAADAYDIGPQTIGLFTKIIKDAKTIVWNGPVGKWEDNRYELGTRAIAEELALLDGSKVIVGGGDTIAALSAFGLLGKMGYVSLGGGAMLEFLSAKSLPGIRAIQKP